MSSGSALGRRPSLARRLLRRSQFVLPALAVLLIGVARLGRGQPQPVLGVRIWSGPQPRVGLPWSLRLAAVWVYGDQRQAASVTLSVRLAADRALLWQGATDSSGAAELAIPWPAAVSPSAALAVELPDGTELARGALALPARWQHQRPPLGGWAESAGGEGLRLRVALEHGALAVPFDSAVWLELQPPQAAELELELRGAQALSGPLPTRVSAGRRLRIRLRPEEHSVSLHAIARAEGGAEARLLRALPTVPGALWVESAGGGLEVRSPIARNRAYVTLVSKKERLWAGEVALQPDGQGAARGFLRSLPQHLPSGPIWAVVSSAPDRRSPGTVGWPLLLEAAAADRRALATPPATFTPREELVLDSVESRGAAEQARARRLRFRLGVASVGLAALAALRIARPGPGPIANEAGRAGRFAAATLVVAGCGLLAWLACELP